MATDLSIDALTTPIMAGDRGTVEFRFSQQRDIMTPANPNFCIENRTDARRIEYVVSVAGEQVARFDDCLARGSGALNNQPRVESYTVGFNAPVAPGDYEARVVARGDANKNVFEERTAAFTVTDPSDDPPDDPPDDPDPDPDEPPWGLIALAGAAVVGGVVVFGGDDSG
jgi:hypothetical protein